MGVRGATGYRVGSSKGIVDVHVVRVLVNVWVWVLAPPRWSASGRSEHSASIDGFVSSRATRNDRHFRELREAVGTWFDRRFVAWDYESGIDTLVGLVGAIR